MDTDDIDKYEYTDVKHYLFWQIFGLVCYLVCVLASISIVLMDASFIFFLLFVGLLVLVLFQRSVRSRVSNVSQLVKWFVIDIVAVVDVVVIFSLLGFSPTVIIAF